MINLIFTSFKQQNNLSSNGLRFLPSVGMTAQCVGNGRGRHGGNMYSQNGNNISRRVCPFFFHVAQSFRMERSGMRNLIMFDNELITQYVVDR